MDLSSLLTAFTHTYSIFKDDEDNYRPVKMPTQYTDVPEINIDGLKGHKLMNLENIKSYFKDILDENALRISDINGLRTSLDMKSYLCDYCHHSLLGNRMFYYYCRDCKIDMCSLCFMEKTEEIAIANGAKNYKKRKKALQRCFNGHNIQKRDIGSMHSILMYDCLSCDTCNNNINFVNGETINYYSNRIQNIDMCEECGEKDENKSIIKDKKLIYTTQSGDHNTNNGTFDYFGFGSLFDWIPVIIDEEDNAVLLNCNPDSPNYNKVAFNSIDDHGRQGYDYDNKLILEEAIEKLKSYKNESEDKGGWAYFYNTPIKQYMHELHMNYHYG